MIKNKNIFVILILSILFVGCTDVIDPAEENIRDQSSTYNEPNFGLGLLTQGYTRIPTNTYNFSEVATDDAVSNDVTNGFLRLATGQWTASSNAADRWSSCFSGIQYMNIVLTEADKMKFADDPIIDKLFKERIKGEAYGLRALFMFNLLQSHAGWVNGKLMGVPIYSEVLNKDSDFNVPRQDFNTCVTQIYKDVDSAAVRLPLNYRDIANVSDIPAFYSSINPSVGSYNRAMGLRYLGLVSGVIVKAIRSQTALLAASPAFADGTANGSSETWANAAKYAAEVIAIKGGLTGLPTDFNSGIAWYRNTSQINGLTAGSNPPEVLWRAGTSNNNDLERDHFPPSLFGSGRVNPTQNFVDAFYASNGYPITHPSANYNANNPYANRDPRLAEFVNYHGRTAGVTNAQINMATGTQDPVNKILTSTRTGYYMRKLLRQDVNYNPQGRNTQLHYRPRIRFTEMYLNYAEAANEAWGSVSDPQGNGYTAYDIIKVIRKRALGLNTDPYLESIKNDKDAMRELIRNERRLELSFEGFRFWDLRRWKVPFTKLTEPAKGITISGTLAAPIYSAPTTVENRAYQNHMYYGPIPYLETLKFTNLLQNDLWNN